MGFRRDSRMEIELAQVEMPGLMSCIAEFGPAQPLAGANISGSLHMTIQTAVLIETLVALGANVRWCSCNIFSTQDHAAAAVARDSAAVFAWKGETLEEYWWCTDQMLNWGEGSSDIIVDDGGDATLLIHEGYKAELEFAKSGAIPDPASTDNAEMKCVLKIIAENLEDQPEALAQDRVAPASVSPRRPPPVSSACTRCRRRANSSSRPSTSTTPSPSASSTTSTAAVTPCPTASCAPPTS